MHRPQIFLAIVGCLDIRTSLSSELRSIQTSVNENKAALVDVRPIEVHYGGRLMMSSKDRYSNISWKISGGNFSTTVEDDVVLSVLGIVNSQQGWMII